MSDLIDRDEALKVIRELSDVNLNNTDYADGFADGYNAGVKDAEPKKGKWIVWGGMDVPENHDRHKCSECREFALLRYEKPLRKEVLSDFCPNCGAKMEKEENEK